jgi:hypothetical protein
LLKVLRAYRLVKIPSSHLELEYSVAVHIARAFLWVFLICHVLGCVWFLILELANTTEVHISKENVNTPSTELGWYLFAFRDGMYILLGRVRPAHSDMEMGMQGVLGPLGSFFFARSEFLSGVTIWSKSRFVVDFRNLLFGCDSDLSFSKGYSLMKNFNYEANFTAKCDT